MLIVHVHVHVKQKYVEAFKEAITENARESLKEEGVVRFDIMQRSDDPERFVLQEVYRDEDAPKRHKETAHYKKWRAVVEEMMAEPRYSIKYQNIFPGDGGWG